MGKTVATGETPTETLVSSMRLRTKTMQTTSIWKRKTVPSNV